MLAAVARDCGPAMAQLAHETAFAGDITAGSRERYGPRSCLRGTQAGGPGNPSPTEPSYRPPVEPTAAPKRRLPARVEEIT